MTQAQAKIFTIPAGLPFAKILAQSLMERAESGPFPLPAYRVLLPTRRACRVLRDSFLECGGGRPMLLPRMQPLGDIDEEELSLALAGSGAEGGLLDIPPALSPLQRQILLARTIYAMEGFGQGFEQALGLAEALGRFMDQVITEGLNLAGLATLVPAEFAGHWQITLDFLSILSEHWPKILAERGVIDAAERRNRLLRALSAHWKNFPPETPVIAAGSTGSIPAAAALLATIAALPEGAVILPGLDPDLNGKSWQALEDSHPQAGLKRLLAQMELRREQVRPWPFDPAPYSRYGRRGVLARELMRPAETTGAWTGLAADATLRRKIQDGLEGLDLITCRDQREEAETIAVALREALETPGRTAALITPDRTLARRVAVACERWGISVDDSAGKPLAHTPPGLFLKLGARACLEQLAPVTLLALLKHSYCHAGIPPGPYRKAVEQLDGRALRGLKPAPGWAGLHERLAEQEDKGRPCAEALDLIRVIEPVMTPLMILLTQDKPLPFQKVLTAHIAMSEALAATAPPGRAILWTGEDGEEAALFLSALQDQAHMMPDLDGAAYCAVLERLLAGAAVRPAFGTHPRLKILGQMEARLSDADLLILGGLNEGSWPPDAGFDPWMSRPMRRDFGLPAPERVIGQAAHDFEQAFCAPEVLLTRAARVEGAPAVPSRWLQRLDTVLQAAGCKNRQDTQNRKNMAALLDVQGEVKPVMRPAPCPPLAVRPDRLSVTKIETWLKDPYAIYARYILNLEKLDPLEKKPDAADRGTILHAILDRFVSESPAALPDDAPDILRAYAAEEIARHHDDPALWSFWWPRFEQLCSWLSDHERDWRAYARPLGTEVKGELTLSFTGDPDFTLSAIADRIDRYHSGAAAGKMAIIDYKSGGAFTVKCIRSGDLPQLALEALILLRGGFQDIPAGKAATLAYWKLTGGREAGAVTALQAGPEGNLNALAESAETRLRELIYTFRDPETPYYSLPRPDRAPRFNDYEHLARVKEWTALGEQENEAV